MNFYFFNFTNIVSANMPQKKCGSYKLYFFPLTCYYCQTIPVKLIYFYAFCSKVI